ncbi:MAG: GlsB/YeaQ/YmgE family stress response membrane protein [Chloroflexota bacterium]|nr:MAG: GlsB/YeaQ/YmgE family stress response membrane protein [Chloroflexota bacterium]
MLVMAGIIGWLADQIVPGRMPFGVLGAVVAGLLGSWLGWILIGNFGPPIFGIRVIPAFLGALILTAAVSLLGPVIGGKKPRNLPTRWTEP